MEFKVTCDVICSKLDFIIVNIIIKWLCITEDGIELWNNDPVEYIRRSCDCSESSFEPQYGAYQLLVELFKTKTSIVFTPLMNYIGNELVKYQNSNITVKDHHLKDGLMNAIGILAPQLLRMKEYSEQLVYNNIF